MTGTSSSTISIGNYNVLDGTDRTEVHGEATNNSQAERSASIKATFYDASGKIIGTATGILSQIAPGETKTFTLRSSTAIPPHARFKVQVDAVYPS